MLDRFRTLAEGLDHPEAVAWGPDGRVWAGGEAGQIYAIGLDGTVEEVEEASRFPNACCLSASRDALLVIESTLPGVSRIPFREDGSAGPAEILVELPGTVPDGIAVDADGAMYVSCYRPDSIYRVEPDGSFQVIAGDPVGLLFNQPTSIAFAGDDLGLLVVANLGGWHLAVGEVGYRSAPLAWPEVP